MQSEMRVTFVGDASVICEVGDVSLWSDPWQQQDHRDCQAPAPRPAPAGILGGCAVGGAPHRRSCVGGRMLARLSLSTEPTQISRRVVAGAGSSGEASARLVNRHDRPVLGSSSCTPLLSAGKAASIEQFRQRQ
jgi:hypothetical protein